MFFFAAIFVALVFIEFGLTLDLSKGEYGVMQIIVLGVYQIRKYIA